MGRVPSVSVAVVSIGCTDPWNAAGLGLDIRALAACGVRPLSVVAGVTAQAAHGVTAATAVAPDLIAAQLASLQEAEIGAYRIGALLERASVEVVARHLRKRAVPAVYDPVFAPSGGGRFASDDAVAAIRSELVPLVYLVTPNLSEAAALTGAAVDDPASMERAARALVASGAGAALVKGGHLHDRALDVLADAAGVETYEAARIAGSLRGTGCLLACGAAAALARGENLRAAVAAGRTLVRERFVAAESTGGMHVAY
jgi:hydroxymethylpyrimidine/phosphomethylpyrimidine kinase